MATIRQAWVTTTDNPFDPFDEDEAWKRFDEDHGYYTTNYMMRIANASDEEGEQAYWNAIEDAVDEIVDLNITGNYKKVVREVPEDYTD